MNDGPTRLSKILGLSILIVSLSMVVIELPAQFQKVFDFPGGTSSARPIGPLVSDGTFLYGMTFIGGANGMGTIFKIRHDGTGFVVLLDFAGSTNGRNPRGGLFHDGTFLYGLTEQGGTANAGTVFKIMPDGSGYVKLMNMVFGAPTGGNPEGTLIYDGTFLYGLCATAGINNDGTLFKIRPDGTGFSKLLDFDVTPTGDGPLGSPVFVGTRIYGMTQQGGASGAGTVFGINTDGTGYLRVLDFVFASSGSIPQGSVISDGTFLYGVAAGGGANLQGTLVKVRTDGTGYQKLLDFDGAGNGSDPFGDLALAGGYLYGTATAGGTNDDGTFFRILPDGTGYSKLMDFDNASNGSVPTSPLYVSGNDVFGTTQFGGANNAGTIFKFTMPVVPPTITGFTPASGLVGTTITISGTDFSAVAANNLVQFNGVAAVVISATPTTITAVVPAGATTGPITVTIGANTATSTNPFTILTDNTAGQLIVYNAVSPSGDSRNEVFYIESIDQSPATAENKVTIFNRWGTVVFETINYNNTTSVFRGISNSGDELPTGTYFYTLEFPSGAPKRSGFISLRR